MKKIAYLSVAVLGLALAFFVHAQTRPIYLTQEATVRRDAYQYLNPTRVIDLKRHYIIDFHELRDEIKLLFSQKDFKTYFYMQFLNNGAWVGVNEREYFEGASLVKVPLAMATLKAVEAGKIRITDTYTVDQKDLSDGYGDLYKKGAGGVYTIKELLSIMLEHSDNTARNAIYAALRGVGIHDPLYEIYTELGWEELPVIISGDIQPDPQYNRITLKMLSNMFLSLYNATYLNFDNSQLILNHLAETPFNTQLVAGVPRDVRLSHKHGVAANQSTFSDCGIVYVPGSSYLLCVAVEGSKAEQVANIHIADISRRVYNFITHH